MTQEKRVVMDFIHLNVRIAKNDLAYPLVRDTFSVLCNSKCKYSFSIRFKGCILFMKTFRIFEKILQYITIFWKCIIYIYQRIPMGLNISPSIWQSCINAILECVQSRKDCEAIMDDFFCFSHL